MATQHDIQTGTQPGQPVSGPTPVNLDPEIYQLHTVEAILKAISALAEDQEAYEIKRLCEVAIEQTSAVGDRLDRIAMGLRGVQICTRMRGAASQAAAQRPTVGA